MRDELNDISLRGTKREIKMNDKLLLTMLDIRDMLLNDQDLKTSINKSMKLLGSCLDFVEIKFYIVKNGELDDWLYLNEEFNNYSLRKILTDIKEEMNIGKAKLINSKFSTKQISINNMLLIPVHDETKLCGLMVCINSPYLEEKGLIQLNYFDYLINAFNKYFVRKKLEGEMNALTYCDSLTGLNNRRYFEFEFNKIDTEENLPISIIVADVNGLKLINDAFGHQKGDVLIKSAANVIKTVCRSQDVIARWGGDEFIVLLPQTSYDETRTIVNEIYRVSNQTTVENLSVSFSLAFDTKVSVDIDLSETLRVAENMMYRQKLVESTKNKEQTISMIINNLFNQFDFEKEHAQLVSSLCVKIGEEMNLSPIDINKLRKMGMYHDVGNVAIKEELINKQRELTDSEWNEVKRHAEIGYRILSSTNETSDIADLILSHHELLDGSGYPNGTTKEGIPLLTRILTVVETYVEKSVELNSEDEAISYLVSNSCYKYDYHVVKAFVRDVLKKPWYSVMTGVTDVIISKHSRFDSLSNICVNDLTDPKLSVDDILVIGDVDTERNGSYTIIYDIHNQFGQMERVERKVYVGEYKELLTFNAQNNSSDDYQWKIIQQDGALFETKFEPNLAEINLIVSGMNVWSSQIISSGITLEEGKMYVISVNVRALKPTKITVSVGWLNEEINYWTSFLGPINNKIDISTEEKTIQKVFKMEKETYNNTDLKFEFGKIEPNTLFIKDVKLYEFIIG